MSVPEKFAQSEGRVRVSGTSEKAFVLYAGAVRADAGDVQSFERSQLQRHYNLSRGRYFALSQVKGTRGERSSDVIFEVFSRFQ